MLINFFCHMLGVPCPLGSTLPGLRHLRTPTTPRSPVPPPSPSPSALPAHSHSPTPLPSPSSGYISTDTTEDCCRGYAKHVHRGKRLRIINRNGQPRCPICTGQKSKQWTMDSAKNHVLGIIQSSKHDDKKRSRHRRPARNEHWL